MIVRCGRCGAQFDVPGPGMHSCPTCGTRNDVRGAAGPPPGASRPAPPPDRPSRRVPCPDCGFSFIVGDVESAPCPNCGNPVSVPVEEGEEE